MLGQFIFHTFNHANLSLKVLLRNTVRNGVLNELGSNAKNMYVSLNAYHSGILVFSKNDFCTISPGGSIELSESNCPILAYDTRDYVLVAHCKRDEGSQYFAQEHQVTYSRKGDSRTTSLVYDQSPVLEARLKPIVLLAPKVWVSKDVNTYISIANGDYNTNNIFETPWKIDLIAQNGKIIRSLKLNLKQKDLYFLNVKAMLTEYPDLTTDKLQMITVVAKGESSACAILTFLQNTITGALALEHSLSPHYYMNGDFNKVRKEALLFEK